MTTANRPLLLTHTCKQLVSSSTAFRASNHTSNKASIKILPQEPTALAVSSYLQTYGFGWVTKSSVHASTIVNDKVNFIIRLVKSIFTVRTFISRDDFILYNVTLNLSRHNSCMAFYSKPGGTLGRNFKQFQFFLRTSLTLSLKLTMFLGH